MNNYQSHFHYHLWHHYCANLKRPIQNAVKEIQTRKQHGCTSANLSPLLWINKKLNAHPFSWPVKLASGHDFFMQPCWHPDGQRIAFVAWDHPNMPWDGTRLYLCRLANGFSSPIIAQNISGSTIPVGGITMDFTPDATPCRRSMSMMMRRASPPSAA